MSHRIKPSPARAIVVIGSGASEHALADALMRGGDIVTVVPGNTSTPGSTLEEPTIDHLLSIQTDLYVINPDNLLAVDLADELRALGKYVFGPGSEYVRLEKSRCWMRKLLEDSGVPMARGRTSNSNEAARLNLNWLRRTLGVKTVVVKADIPKDSNDVLVTSIESQAREDAERKSDKIPHRHGDPGPALKVVLEEFLLGRKATQYVLSNCDSAAPIIFPGAQVYKALDDGDTGNCNCVMGAYSPLDAHPDEFTQDEEIDIYKQTTAFLLRYFEDHGLEYRGVLAAELMLTEDGPKVLKYNDRFGDPESSAIFARCTGGLGEALYAIARGEPAVAPTFSDEVAVCVVLATRGYAETSDLPKGEVITGLEAASSMPGVKLYFAGVSKNDAGDVVTNGGRVINVVGLGPDLKSAREKAYAAVAEIHWGDEGPHYRTDIGIS